MNCSSNYDLIFDNKNNSNVYECDGSEYKKYYEYFGNIGNQQHGIVQKTRAKFNPIKDVISFFNRKILGNTLIEGNEVKTQNAETNLVNYDSNNAVTDTKKCKYIGEIHKIDGKYGHCLMVGKQLKLTEGEADELQKCTYYNKKTNDYLSGKKLKVSYGNNNELLQIDMGKTTSPGCEDNSNVQNKEGYALSKDNKRRFFYKLMPKIKNLHF